MANVTVNEDDRCHTCGNTYGWHLETSPVHPFNTGESGATAFLRSRRDRDTQRGVERSQRGPETPSVAPFPFDPVLRQALIDAGVLTADDLVRAEMKIRAVTGMFNQSMGEGDGQQSGR